MGVSSLLLISVIATSRNHQIIFTAAIVPCLDVFFFREKVGIIIDKDKPGHSDLSGCYSFLQTCLGNFSGNRKLFELS